MADTPDNHDADEAARRVYAEHADDVQSHVTEADAKLGESYTKASSDVRELVAARGEGATPQKVANDVERVLDATLVKRLVTMRVSIEESAKKGVQAARKTFRAVYGQETLDVHVRAGVKALEEGARRIAGRTSVDGVALAKRVKRRDAEVVAQIKTEVDDTFRATRSILDSADKIASIDGAVEAKLPKYLQEMADAARKVDAATSAGDKTKAESALKRVVARHKKYIESLGEIGPDGEIRASAYSLRGSSKRFAKDIIKARGQDVDNLIAKNLEERALYRARLIARHESNEALRTAYIESTKNKPGVVGFRWLLGSRHPRPDECDVYAAANTHNLGPGGYPADALPSRHPLCLCQQVAIVDQAHFSRPENSHRVPPEFRDNVSPGPDAWFKRNPDDAAAILGPTRHKLMQQGVTVTDANGKPLLLRDILGFAQAAE